jgi:nitroreductase
MEFNKVLEDRRSIRKYKSDPISVDSINYILKNASLSPSAHNKQPWHYFVFTETKKIELETLISDYITNKQKLTYYEKIMRNCLGFIKEAPVVILVYSTLEENSLNDYLSLGASIEHICLSAKNINMGSLWLGVVSDFKKLLESKYDFENMNLISAIVLGYPDEDPKPRPRKKIDEIVTFM